MSDELEKKKESWKKYDVALDKMVFNGKANDLLNSIIDDYTPNTNKKPGISFKTIFKAVKFFFTSPGKTLDLINMATSGTLQDKDFQKHLIAKEQLWDMVQNKTPEILPKIGKMLAASGVKEFEKGNILDESALNNIAKGLGNKDTLTKVKEVAKEALSENTNWKELASKGLNIISTDKNLSEYAKNRGDDLGRYVSQKLTQVSPNDVKQKLENSINANSIQNPKFIEKFTEVISNNINNKKAIEDKDIKNILDFKNISKTQQEQAIAIAKELFNTTKPALQEAYGIGELEAKSLTKIVPALLKEPKDLENIFNSFKKDDYVQTTIDLLSMIDKNPLVKEYFKESKDSVVKVLNNTFENTKSLKDLSLKGDLYEIVPSLLEHPKELISIIKCQETKEYEKGAREFLDIVKNDKNIQEYFQNKGENLLQVGKKAMGLEDSEIKNDVGKLFGILMKGENVSKIQDLIDIYQSGQYTKLISSTCKMIEDDKNFAQYMKDNNESLSKIIDAVVVKSPALKANLKGIKVSELTTTILKDPKSIRELVESYEKGGIISGAYNAVKVLSTNQEIRGAIYNTLYEGAANYINSGNNLGSKLLIELSNKDLKKQISLDEFVNNKLSSNSLSEEDKQQIIKLNKTKDLFNNITINSPNKEIIKLENIVIKDNQIINSIIKNVSFKNSILENVSFNGTTMENINFNGATIDGNTLSSMMENVRSNKISLEGAKIIGSLDNIDLSKVSLKNVDLSKVTSMNGVNLNGTDFTGVKLPDDKKIITNTFNIDKVLDTNGLITKEMINDQSKYLVNVVTDATSRALVSNNLEAMDKKSQEDFKKTLESIISKKDKLSEYVVNAIQSDVSKILTNDVIINKDKVNSFSDYKGTKYTLDNIIRNRKNENLKDTIVSAIVAENVIEKLFGKGDNRGKDGLFVKEIIQESIKELIKSNDKIDIIKAIDNDKLTKDIYDQIYQKSNYTLAGNITGGIQLKQEIVNDKELISNITKSLDYQLNVIANFNEKELSKINDISKQIGINLFESGANSTRVEDVKIIEKSLHNMFIDFKTKNNLSDISNIIEKNQEYIVGKSEIEKGWLSNSVNRTGLTKLFYDNSSYTKAGMMTGGIYIEQSKLESPNFVNELKNNIKSIISDDIKHALQNQELKENVSSDIKSLLKSPNFVNELKNNMKSIISDDIKHELQNQELKEDGSSNIRPSNIPYIKKHNSKDIPSK